MNCLSLEKRAQIVGMMVEGMSLRSITRLTGVSKNTLAKFLADIGSACVQYHDEHVRNLQSKRVQCDEIWSFVGMKQSNVPDELRGSYGVGDVYTWTALDADSKLIAAYRVDTRDSEAATAFIGDLESRLANRVQLTTDGHKPYMEAVEKAFAGEVDYGQIVKSYGAEPVPKEDQRRYSPARFKGAEKRVFVGDPDKKHVSTSFVERQNLSMRMGMRRFTRLTNAFSKKVENHAHAVALYFLHYNFCRIHQSLRITPAMEAGICDHVWTLQDIAALVKDEAPKKRGPYKTKAKEAEIII